MGIDVINDRLLPGRYAAVIDISGTIDENAIIGFDEPMQTHFLQSGMENKQDGSPLIWLGVDFRKYPTMSSLLAGMDKLKLKLLELEFEPWSSPR